MTGINIATTTVMGFGTATGIVALVEPRDLEGLGPTALLALITLAALATLIYLVRCFLPVLRDLVKEISKNTATSTELCARLNVRPCMLNDVDAKK